jgi:hypothetical protein
MKTGLHFVESNRFLTTGSQDRAGWRLLYRGRKVRKDSWRWFCSGKVVKTHRFFELEIGIVYDHDVLLRYSDTIFRETRTNQIVYRVNIGRIVKK